MTMKPDAMSRRRPLFWFCLIGVTALVIAAAVCFVPRQRESRAPVKERARAELILKDDRLFESNGVTPFSGFVLTAYDGGEKKSRSSVSNGWLQGLSVGWHTNGQQQVEEHYAAGVSQGLRTKWYPNGQKLSEVTVVNGKLEGLYRTWHENGGRAEEVELKDGQPDGLSQAWFPSGCLKARVTLRNGTVVDQKFWKDGECNEEVTTNSDSPAGN